MSPRLVFAVVFLALIGWFAADPVLTVWWAMGAAGADEVARAPGPFERETRWVYGAVGAPRRRTVSRETGLPADEYLLAGAEGRPIRLVIEAPAADRWNQQEALREAAVGGRAVVLCRGRWANGRFEADRVRVSAMLEWLLRTPPTEEALMAEGRRPTGSR